VAVYNARLFRRNIAKHANEEGQRYPETLSFISHLLISE